MSNNQNPRLLDELSEIQCDPFAECSAFAPTQMRVVGAEYVRELLHKYADQQDRYSVYHLADSILPLVVGRKYDNTTIAIRPTKDDWYNFIFDGYVTVNVQVTEEYGNECLNIENMQRPNYIKSHKYHDGPTSKKLCGTEGQFCGTDRDEFVSSVEVHTKTRQVKHSINVPAIKVSSLEKIVDEVFSDSDTILVIW